MSKQVRFYAVLDDLVASIQRVEDQLDLKYADAWLHESPDDTKCFDSLLKWSGLGVNETGRVAGAGFFLVQKKDRELIPKTVFMNDGDLRFKYEPILNPGSIVLQPSGLYHGTDAKGLVVGMFGTAMKEADSVNLFKEFKRFFLRGYVYIDRQYYVGPRTKELMEGELELL